jgi:hypothetical protein
MATKADIRVSLRSIHNYIEVVIESKRAADGHKCIITVKHVRVDLVAYCSETSCFMKKQNIQCGYTLSSLWLCIETLILE